MPSRTRLLALLALLAATSPALTLADDRLAHGLPQPRMIRKHHAAAAARGFEVSRIVVEEGDDLQERDGLLGGVVGGLLGGGNNNAPPPTAAAAPPSNNGGGSNAAPGNANSPNVANPTPGGGRNTGGNQNPSPAPSPAPGGNNSPANAPNNGIGAIPFASASDVNSASAASPSAPSSLSISASSISLSSQSSASSSRASSSSTTATSSSTAASTQGPLTLTQTATQSPTAAFSDAKTDTATPTPSASSADSDSGGGMGHAALIGVIVAASVVGAVIAIWTIVRKTKFSPSKRFENRLNPIDFDPHGAGASADSESVHEALGGIVPAHRSHSRMGSGGSDQSFVAGRPTSMGSTRMMMNEQPMTELDHHPYPVASDYPFGLAPVPSPAFAYGPAGANVARSASTHSQEAYSTAHENYTNSTGHAGAGGGGGGGGGEAYADLQRGPSPEFDMVAPPPAAVSAGAGPMGMYGGGGGGLEADPFAGGAPYHAHQDPYGGGGYAGGGYAHDPNAPAMPGSSRWSG